MFDGLVPLLALFTFLAVIVLALISKERTKDRKRDPNAPTSTLAKDGKYGGVAFLQPPRPRSFPGEAYAGDAFTGQTQPAQARPVGDQEVRAVEDRIARRVI